MQDQWFPEGARAMALQGAEVSDGCCCFTLLALVYSCKAEILKFRGSAYQHLS